MPRSATTRARRAAGGVDRAPGAAGAPLPGIDELLPPNLRQALEERFWRPIGDAMTLEAFVHDPSFIADPVNHTSLFSDHGVVHARDVAAGVLSLTDTVNGVLLPLRPAERQEFLAAYGLVAAYLHDIGMLDQTRVGRRLHPVYAAHVAFGSDLDDVVTALLAEGPVARRLRAVHATAAFACPPDVVLRELLSLSLAHSKSAAPAQLLDDRLGLRRLAQATVLTDLATHRSRGVLPTPDDVSELSANTERYAEPREQSFAWLVSDEPVHRSLADDVVDALRVLRAADALRQRGTSLKTTAGFEIFIDAASGRAVFALRPKDNSKVYLLTGDSPKSAGEANLRVAVVSPNGHLRFAFFRGEYLDADATRYAAESTALIVADIVEDVVGSFSSGAVPADLQPPAVSSTSMKVQLERPDDNPAFADDVASLIAAHNPELAERVVTVADLEGASPDDRERYHRGIPIDSRSEEARTILAELAARGTKVDEIDVDAAFADVRRVRLQAGEVVASKGAEAAFVYVATGPGLRVQPGGGYPAESVAAWVPVGTTGVIRRAERNAEVSVDRDVDILMIPGECYVREWFRPYTAEELVEALRMTDGR